MPADLYGHTVTSRAIRNTYYYVLLSARLIESAYAEESAKYECLANHIVKIAAAIVLTR
jgi:hypothetical protein